MVISSNNLFDSEEEEMHEKMDLVSSCHFDCFGRMG